MGFYVLDGTKDLDAIATIPGGRLDNPHWPCCKQQAKSELGLNWIDVTSPALELTNAHVQHPKQRGPMTFMMFICTADHFISLDFMHVHAE